MMRLRLGCSAAMLFVGLAVAQEPTQAPIQIPDSSTALLVRKVAPVYPPLARQARIQGTVLLSIVIDREGVVRDTRLVSGHPMLAPAAVEAVKQWKYKPYISGDEAAAVETTVQIRFKLADDPETRDAAVAHADSSQGAGAAQLVRVAAGVMERILAQKVDPEYPTEAKEKHIEGTVLPNVNIDKEGNVARVELVSGDPRLAPAAMDAVLEWKYRPLLLNGEPTAAETTLQVKFALEQ